MQIIIRAFVVVLVLTGSAASTHISNASAQTIAATSMTSSFMPVPTCPPDGTTDCGIGAAKGK